MYFIKPNIMSSHSKSRNHTPSDCLNSRDPIAANTCDQTLILNGVAEVDALEPLTELLQDLNINHNLV